MDDLSLTYFAEKAESIALAFVMAINGAFFSIRAAGVTPTPQQIERAKNNVAKARYIYVDGINSIVSEITQQAEIKEKNFNELSVDFITRHLIGMGTELTVQANRALVSGHQNKAATLLKSNARGAMGELIQQRLSNVELSVTDASGKQWSEPSKVIRATVQNFAQNLLGED